MKNVKITLCALVSALIVPFAASAAYEPITADVNSINIVVDGKRVVADNFLYNDTTYVPLRRVAEMLGKEVEWNEADNAALITDSEEVVITDETESELNEKFAQTLDVERNTINIFVNGEKVDADNFLYNDRTYVPLRKVSEMFGKNVSWNQLTNTATIGQVIPSVFDGNVIGNYGGIDYTDTLFEAYKKYFAANSAEGEDVETLANEQIMQDCALLSIAEENGITAGVTFENEYQQFIKDAIENYGGEETFYAILEQGGYSLEMYHYVQLVNYIYGEVADKLAVFPTDEEVMNYYNENLETIFAFNGVRAKHILIMPKADEEGKSTDKDWEEAKKKADDVYKLAKDGKDFDSLIAEYNEDPGVEQNPDGYSFARGQMVPEFEDACYSMEVGEISEPVKTDYGYHIIKLEEKLPYFKFDEQVEAFIKANLSNQKFVKTITEKMTEFGYEVK